MFPDLAATDNIITSNKMFTVHSMLDPQWKVAHCIMSKSIIRTLFRLRNLAVFILVKSKIGYSFNECVSSSLCVESAREAGRPWPVWFVRVWVMVRAIFLTRVISFLLASSAHFSLSPRSLSELPSPGSCRSSPGRCCARISGVSCGPETLGEASEWPGDYSAPLRVYIKAIIHLSREKTSSRKGGTGLHQIDSDIQSILF